VIVLAGAALVAGALGVANVRGYFFLFDDYALVAFAREAPFARVVADASVLGFLRPCTLALLRAQAALFGWQAPAGYAAFSLLLHGANAWLLARVVAGLFPRSPAIAPVAAATFLLSPWAAEAVFWVSAQADLLGTFFALGSLATALAASAPGTSGRGAGARLAGAAALAAAATFSKEAFVTLPAAFVAVAACRRFGGAPGAPRRELAVTAALAGSVALYAAARSSVLPGPSGAYGHWLDLVRVGSPAHLVHRLVVPPSAPLAAGPRDLVRAAVILAAGAVVATAARARLRATVALLCAVAVALLPVLPFDLSTRSASGGRLLYWPGAFLAAVYALGLAGSGGGPRIPASRTPRIAHAAGLILGTYLLASLGHQSGLWRTAAGVARTCVAQVSPARAESRDVYIPNLPAELAKAPTS
jgi:hypothetical protein